MLALERDGRSLQAREVAAELGLPPDFLTKILRRLTATGLVTSQRGRTGGFRLGRRPEEISLLDIVAPFEGHETGVECLLGQAFCSDHEACPLHVEWVEIRVRFLDLLERTRLADVAERAVRSSFFPIHRSSPGCPPGRSPHPP